MQIMVPFQREQIDLVYNIPLAMEIINSDVPFVLSN
ncbi:MAG: sporulation protein YunB [Clostridium sp.]|nr:MAG: sporulation protein YunB [Clostridium sp.]